MTKVDSQLTEGIPMNTLPLLPFAALILAACGGANEGANPAATTRSSPSGQILMPRTSETGH